jgi:hypothetical protein
MTITFSPEGRDGTVKNGGTSSGTFAKDGGISYLGLHPTSVFALSVQVAHQVCWHILLPFYSLSIYDDEVYDVTIEDGNDIALPLEQLDRVHRIRIPMSVPNRIHHRLVGELSHSLRPDDGELPLELLHRLQELQWRRR